MTKYNINKENELVTNSKIMTSFDRSKADSRKNRAIAKQFAKIRQELNENIGISSNFKIPIMKTEPKVEMSETKIARDNHQELQKSFKKKKTPTPFVYRLALKSLIKN
jgi:hypothetical protein